MSQVDRRRARRRVPESDEPMSRVRLRIGAELAVIDVSDTGLFTEGSRLNPGSRVDVHVIGKRGRVLVRCTVLRAFVSALSADRIRFRAALLFDQALDSSTPG